MRRIGLTGGIATGKSTVSAMLLAAGVPVIDADVAAREVVAPKSAGLQAIIDRFGKGYVQRGALNRKKLGELIFNDATARADLEEVLSPFIITYMQSREVERWNEGHRLVVWDVPLLFEKGMHMQCMGTILVDVSESIQLERLMARDKLTEREALLRMAAQMPMSEKRKLASVVVTNAGSLAFTAAALTAAWASLVGDGRVFTAPEGSVELPQPTPAEEALYRQGRTAAAIKQYRVRLQCTVDAAEKAFNQFK
jgi:dephospho-CoA kinase